MGCLVFRNQLKHPETIEDLGVKFMFGWFKKDPAKERPPEEYEGLVVHHYEGQILSPEYNVNDPEAYPYHAMYPHGYGKIDYIFSGEVIESYEGKFDTGQYSGNGKLTKYGEVYEGLFLENEYIGPASEDDIP